MSTFVRVSVVAALATTSACTVLPAQEEEGAAATPVEIGATQQALSEVAAPSSSSSSSLTLSWELESPVAERGAAETYALAITSHDDAPIDGEIELELDGLGVERTQTLGVFTVNGKGRRVVGWSPGASPIAPMGTLLRVKAKVRYTLNGVAYAIPAPALFASFSSNGQRVFASTEDGQRVRLRALGRPATGPVPVTAEDVVAERSELGARRGRLDGALIDETRADALTKRAKKLAAKAAQSRTGVTGASSSAESAIEPAVGDSISRDGALTLNAVDPTPTPGPPMPVCPGITYPVNEPTCVKWKSTGFRDIDASAPNGFVAPEETFNPTSARAAYAAATIRVNGEVYWSGRLDANGCTPQTVRYCPQHADVEISTSSLQRVLYVDGQYVPNSREIIVSPARTFTVPVILANSTVTGMPIGAANVYPSSAQDDHLLRIAGIAGRMLTLADSGVGGPTQAPLRIHTENGCCSWPEFQYIEGGVSRCGEACANSNDAWFGQVMRLVNGQYVPTPTHTTEDAYAVAHELGHSTQYASAGGPGGGPYSTHALATGNCSCDHVNDGNRIHCLQSRHTVQAAQAEGFAHHYATRLMNERASNARFTYYKDFRRLVKHEANGQTWFTSVAVPPPVALGVGTPAYDPAYGQTQGWVRAMCNAPNTSSEYDWLTFLWAINGKPIKDRLTMPELFSILGGVPGGDGYTYPSLDARADLVLKKAPEKLFLLRTQAENNGTNL